MAEGLIVWLWDERHQHLFFVLIVRLVVLEVKEPLNL